MECLCLRPGYPGNTNELQIVLKTQKGSYLNQGASQVRTGLQTTKTKVATTIKR